MPWLRRPATHLHIDVPMPPVRVEEQLRGSMAPVRSLLFSPTWGRTEPFVGRVGDGRFEMRVRHAYSNGLTRLLDGRVTRTSSGSRVEGRFRTLWIVVLVLRLAWAAVLVPAGLYLLHVAGHARGGATVSWPGVAAALAVPAVILAILVVVELLGRRLGDADEERMRLHLAGLLAE